MKNNPPGPRPANALLAALLLAALLLAALPSPAPAAPHVAPDLLHFNNGDSFHGSFRGIDAGPAVRWS